MNQLTGTWLLTRVAFRRDRVQLAIWVAALAGVLTGAAAAVQAVLETEQDLISFTELYVVNPTMRLFGLASGASEGGFVMVRAGVFFIAVAALMSFLAVTRHTRQEEDTRRAELIRSGVVGRHAGLATGLIVAATASVLVALLGSIGLMLNGLPTEGSFAAGASIGAAALVFAGIGAVTAQLSSSTRGANGMAALVLGIAYLLAGVGNMLGTADEEALRIHSAWIAWLSPIGWSQQMRPFHDNNWWILVLHLAFFAATAAAAFKLESLRDLGRGMMPERRGPAEAPRSLLSPLGLAWRLQKGLLIGWAVGVGIYGTVIGTVSNEMESLLAELEGVTELIERLGGTESIVDAFFSTVMGMMGTIIAIYALQVLLRMRADEDNGLAAAVLATSVSRARWTLSFITVAVGGTVALLLVAGLTAGIASGIAMRDFWSQLGTLVQAAVVQIPATLVISGAVIATFGLLPRRTTALAWGIFAIALILGPVVGEILDLPGWLRDISPFSHTPWVPAADVTITPIIALAAVGVLLAIAGIASFRRRDLAFQG